MSPNEEKVSSRDAAAEPTINKKGDAYLKIWKSWGMTEEQWNDVQSDKAKATTPKTTLHTADGTLVGELTAVKGA